MLHMASSSSSISLTTRGGRYEESTTRPMGIGMASQKRSRYNVSQQQPPSKRFKESQNKSPQPDHQANNGFQVTNNIKMTSDDILGDTVPFDKLKSLRHFCNHILNLNNSNSRGQRFPGSHPVSLTWNNFQFLRQREYRVTWKADGTRYLMLITWEGCYLIDRKFDFRSVDLRFPCGHLNDEGAFTDTHNYTLLDGEMVIDTDPVTRNQERRFLVYDLIAINGESLVQHPFASRWSILENDVIKPRNMDRSTNPYYRYDLELFRVRRKDFYVLSAVPKLLKDFIPHRLSHASDGLIFQPWDDPYVPLTHAALLKWKYPDMNSVDFLLQVGTDNRPTLCLNQCGRRRAIYGRQGAFRDSSVDIFSLSGKIIECSWDSEENEWVFMRMRPDKSTPNEYITFQKVLRSIDDNIKEEDVINEIQDITRLPMYADRPNS